MIDEKWTRVATVPPSKLKTIGFGALKGKSDINPQWRIKAMTEVYGLCGVGWYHELKEKWSETASNGVVMAFCLVNAYIKVDGEWSKPICGMGGNEIVSLSKGELKPSDEGWKMAYTDALGTALKSIGVASEIYEGNFDGSKYQRQDEPATKNTNNDQSTPKNNNVPPPKKTADELLSEAGINNDEALEYCKAFNFGMPKLKSGIDEKPIAAIEHIKKWKESVISKAEKAIEQQDGLSIEDAAKYCSIHSTPLIKLFTDKNMIEIVLSWKNALNLLP